MLMRDMQYKYTQGIEASTLTPRFLPSDVPHRPPEMEKEETIRTTTLTKPQTHGIHVFIS